jgi:mono/diheme cytochrome c family protein
MGRWARASFLAVGGLLAVGLAGFASGQAWPPLPAHPVRDATRLGLLTGPISDTTPNAAQVRRGRDLVIAGDCLTCHTRAGGPAFAGGLGLKTPFGTIYTANITSDPETGIGAWTEAKFYRAMHEGIGGHGENLYPAFPYPWFAKASRANDDAMLAYLKTTPPARYRRPDNALPFPLNIRWMVKGWNLLFFRKAELRPGVNASPEWSRGAYLVEGLGHCGACHTPKNWLGADRRGHLYQGGELDNWVAPDLTGNARTGLGRWSVADITEYLGTGRNARASAGGAMADVVSFSTALMSDGDRRAIAVYLKSLPASPDARPPRPDAASLARGQQIYSDACASCHLENGVGQRGLFAPLVGNAVAQQANPDGVVHLILAGSRTAPTAARPSPLTMPSFAWKLTDPEIADVATYVRNSWGNRAAPVSARQVRRMRVRLDLTAPRYTVNSGDQK